MAWASIRGETFVAAQKRGGGIASMFGSATNDQCSLSKRKGGSRVIVGGERIKVEVFLYLYKV